MNSQRLLVVDDDRDVGESVCRILRGFGPLYASGVNEAKTIILSNPSLMCVVSDVMMADGTGLDLYEWVMMEQAALKDGFIFMTGGVSKKVFARLVEAAPVLDKPVDIQKLRSLVQARIGV